MLVRFLSFCATILGTARYKAIFLSCLTLVVSLSGVTAVALMNGSGGTNGASATVKEEEELPQENSPGPHLGSARRQNPKQPVEQPTDNGTPAPAENTASKPADAPPKAAATATDIVLSTTDVRLTGEEVKSISVSTSDDTQVQWSVTAREATGGLQVVTPTDMEGKNLTFQTKADKDTARGPYTLVVTAKDSTRNLVITKQIIITVQ